MLFRCLCARLHIAVVLFEKKNPPKTARRANDKLSEINAIVPILSGSMNENELFIDIGGGPGAWSEALLASTTLSGVGITLDTSAPLPPAAPANSTSTNHSNNNHASTATSTSSAAAAAGATSTTTATTTTTTTAASAAAVSTTSTKDKDKESQSAWYPRLMKNARFRALWGADDSGSVFVTANVDRVRHELRFARVVLAVGDAGFAQARSATGEHVENLQELYSARLVLSELLVAATTLVEGGSFVCKLFDTFSALTCSLIYVSRQTMRNKKTRKNEMLCLVACTQCCLFF